MDSESSRYDKLESMLQGGSSEPHNLPLEYLRNITNNFSDELLLGEGGFGTVYMGVLPNGKAIAVKKLNSSIPGVNDRQFENEVNHLMMLKHPNIVVLVGWCYDIKNIYVEYYGKYICAEKLERLLCLEYMPKGNLCRYLSDEFSGLDWDKRYKIIEGLCYGLRYLHEECQINAPILHMDLKPANILLDNNMMPKIADFGLSRLFSEEKTWTRTISRDGTLGYMSPEYINRGLISTKSDIFSLGVIIIEIVTGRRDYPYETGTSYEEFIDVVLNNWSQRKRVETLFRHVPLEVEYQQIRRCIQIGLECVKTDWSKRPTISQVIKALHRPESADSSNIKGVHRPRSGMRERNYGETSWMERPANGFSINENFIVDQQQWQKKTALRRIRVIFTTVFFVVLLKKRGVESVTPDIAVGKVVVTGTADAVELKERIEARAEKSVQIVSAGAGPPKKGKEKEKEKKAGGCEKKADKEKDGGGEEKKVDNEKGGGEKVEKENGSGGEKKADEEKQGADKPKEGVSPSFRQVNRPNRFLLFTRRDKQYSTLKQKESVTLKIRLHCDGCADRIKRQVFKIKGVENVVLDVAKDLVKVTGTMDAAALPVYLKDKLNRDVEIVAPSKKDGGSDKKDKGAGDGGEKDGWGEEKKEPDAPPPNYAAIYGNSASPPPPPTFYRNSTGPSPQVYADPNAYSHLQMFSDENPNSCSVM